MGPHHDQYEDPTIAALRLIANQRAVVVVAVALRTSVVVLLFIAPQYFPFRDYGTEDTAASAFERVWRRPAVTPIAEDELAYDAIARSIASGQGWVSDRNWMLARAGEPTAYGGAAYPLFVGILYAVSGSGFPLVVLVQLALSVWAVVGLMRIGRSLGGETAGVSIGWVAALHPGLAVAPALLMTEALSIPLIVAVVLLALRLTGDDPASTALLAGLAVGVGFLVRSPLGLMGTGCVIAAFLIRGRFSRSWKPSLKGLATSLVTVALVLTPWTIRNYAHFGRFMPTDTKSGINIWMFNLPPGVTDGWDEIGVIDEGQADVLYFRRARDNIGRHFGWWAKETATRALRFWWPVPRQMRTPLHWIGVGLYTTLTLAALAGTILLVVRGVGGEQRAWILLVPMVVGWGLMAITAVGLRHRLTVEPLLMISAGMLLGMLLRRRIGPSTSLSSDP